MSSETPYDQLGPAARKAVLAAMMQERYGPMEMLEEERPTRYVLEELIATIADLSLTPPATSSRPSKETTESLQNSTGAPSAETSTPQALDRLWEDEQVRHKTLDALNRAYTEDAAFKHLRKQAGRPNRYVPGDGPATEPRLMIVGEAPGAKEQAEGRPFVGVSGNMLTSMLWELRVHRKDCYVTNLVKYRPPNNRKPTPEEMEAAAPYLRDEIRLVYPQGGTVVILGATALEVINPDKRVLKDQAKSFMQGRWTFVPMAHPSYVVQGRMKRDIYAAAWASLLPLVSMPGPRGGRPSHLRTSTASEDEG